MSNQIRRAAVSVPSNIAEGYGRLTDLQFRHFLGNARGSLYELQTQIELAADLGYFDAESAQKLLEQGSEVARLINGLVASLSDYEPAEALTAAPLTPLTPLRRGFAHENPDQMAAELLPGNCPSTTPNSPKI